MKPIRFYALTVVAAVGLAGCDNKPANTGSGTGAGATTSAKDASTGKNDHEHGAGPHGGPIGEFGGQYHLDLMFWPWKLGISMASAGLIVAVTANLVRNDGQITRRALLFCSLLIAILAVAGVVTYYYHLNEPADQDDNQDDEPAKISRVVFNVVFSDVLPDAGRVSSMHHR